MTVNKFLIIGLPRSGTTYLATLLNSHKDIECSGELFNPYGIIGIGESDNSFESVAKRDAKPHKFFSDFFSKNTNAKALGFKFMIGHNADILKSIHKYPNISIIYVLRRNKLAQISSLLTALKTKAWALTEEMKQSATQEAVAKVKSAISTPSIKARSLFKKREPSPEVPPPETDLLDAGPRAISQHWHEYETFDYLFATWLKSIPNRRLIVEYKSLFDAEFPEKICEFLNVPYDEDMESDLLKQSTNKIIDRFQYRKLIADYFRNRGLGHWTENELQDTNENHNDN